MASFPGERVTVGLLLALALAGAHGDLGFSTYPDHLLPMESFRILLTETLLTRILGYLVLLLLGLYLVWRSPPIAAWEAPPGTRYLFLYLSIAMASVIWSLDPQLTMKRLFLLGIGLVLSWGLARRYSPSDLLLIFLGASLILLLLGVTVECSTGTFQPLASNYRFSGLFHPNQQAANIAVLLSCLYLGLRTWPSYQSFLLALFMLGVALLILTGSRTFALALGCGVLAGYLPESRRPRAQAGFLVGGFILISAMLLWFLPQLNGRGWLWQTMVPELKLHPMLGHGFGGFWNYSRIAWSHETFGWAVPHAHSTYLDHVLCLGLLGSVPLVAWLVLRLAHALGPGRNSLQSRTTLTLIAIALSAGLTESAHVHPTTLLSLFTLSVCLQARRSRGSTESKVDSEDSASYLLLLGILLVLLIR